MAAQCCYVCLESHAPLLSLCACTDRYVHVACFQELIHRTPAHASKCAVCHAEYRIEKALRGAKCTWDACYILCAALLGINLTLMVYVFSRLTTWGLTWKAQMVVAGSVAFLSVLPMGGCVLLVALRWPMWKCSGVYASRVVCNDGARVPLAVPNVCECRRCIFTVRVVAV